MLQSKKKSKNNLIFKQKFNINKKNTFYYTNDSFYKFLIKKNKIKKNEKELTNDFHFFKNIFLVQYVNTYQNFSMKFSNKNTLNYLFTKKQFNSVYSSNFYKYTNLNIKEKNLNFFLTENFIEHKFINLYMKQGKKTKSYKFYKNFILFLKKYHFGNNLFIDLLNLNLIPLVGTRTKKFGRNIKQIPYILNLNESICFLLKNLLLKLKKKKNLKTQEKKFIFLTQIIFEILHKKSDLIQIIQKMHSGFKYNFHSLKYMW